tara:strand:- start:12 stop:401 length:390 start_codon:yes stop_codon:yes gene_type:complete
MWLSNLSKDQHQALIRLAHNVIVSDGLLDPNEEGMFDLMKKEMGIENSEEVEYLSLDGIETTFPDRKARIIVLINLIRIGYVDGAFEIEEECLLRDLASSFDIELDEFELLDNWVKRLVGLEKEAQALF